ncbi:hypothetical protein D9V37_16330 [Nocardioides mangrovicus]|uniref:Uncharacterized protein n=1 Tax=Nocardioides mangrovicus TaxID=2478913 RepID=A0A3L8NXQ4_9ACTN|nr:hypothetical protein D9V37_16330 [Nocardioides mangrovicus]
MYLMAESTWEHLMTMLASEHVATPTAQVGDQRHYATADPVERLRGKKARSATAFQPSDRACRNSYAMGLAAAVRRSRDPVRLIA